MDLLLRNRSPQNAYDAKLLRERRAEDQRSALRKHLQEEEAHRLNNSFYSRASPASSSSTSPRPYGMLTDVHGEFAAMRRTTDERSPGRLSRGSGSPAGNPDSSFRTSSRTPRLDDSEARPSNPFVTASQMTKPRDPLPPVRTSASPTREEEYAAGGGGSSKGYLSLPPTKLMKAREFSGAQVAYLLSENPRPRPDLGFDDRDAEATLADALQEQIRIQEDDARRRRLAEVKTDVERVRDTVAEARERLHREEVYRLDKQREALRLLQESERLTQQVLEREKERDILEEKMAMREREERERRRYQEMQQRRELVEQRLARTGVGLDPLVVLTNSIPSASPLKEAVRRLCDAHLEELDDIAPVIQDILNEPEFAGSPWL